MIESKAMAMAFPRVFASIFTSDETLLDHVVTPARIYAACIGIFGIQMACQQTFTAIGDAKSSLAAAVMRKFILLIPLIYIVPLLWKDNPEYGVYLAEPIADALAVSFTATLFYFRFKHGHRLKKFYEAIVDPFFADKPFQICSCVKNSRERFLHIGAEIAKVSTMSLCRPLLNQKKDGRPRCRRRPSFCPVKRLTA